MHDRTLTSALSLDFCSCRDFSSSATLCKHNTNKLLFIYSTKSIHSIFSVAKVNAHIALTDKQDPKH